MAAHVPRLPLSLDPLIAEAKRRARQRRKALVIALVAAVVAGGATGSTLALTQSNGFRPAAACPGASTYAYATPGGGWMFLRQPLHIGDRVPVGTGGLWRVTAIAALPNDCQLMTHSEPSVIDGHLGTPGGGAVAGRLILQPVR
jgi:hypothetical protein